MEKFASACLAEVNMIAVQAILDRQLKLISDVYASTVEVARSEFWTLENLRQVVKEASVDCKKSDIRQSLGAGEIGKTEEKRAPQRTAYISFCTKNRAIVREANPKDKNTDITKKLGAMWRELPEEEKELLKEELRKSLDEASITSETSSTSTAKKSSKQTEGKKKRTASSYILFSNATRSKIKEDNPEVDNKTIMKLLGAAWSGLSDGEKQPWKDHANQLKQEAQSTEQAKEPVKRQAKDAKKSKKLSLSEQITRAEKKKDEAKTKNEESLGQLDDLVGKE